MTGQRAGSKALIREINEALVLSELRRQPLCSRSDISRETGLSGPTVSTIAARLIELGLVEEREYGAPSGGRPPVQLALRPAAGYVVGVKVTESQVIGVLTDLNAEVVARRTRQLRSSTVPGVLLVIKGVVDSLTPAAQGGRLLGIGVGLGGVIHRDTGMVRHATYFNWRDVPLASELSRLTGLSVVIDNDVNTLVASEQGWGTGRGIANFAVVSVGRGIGLGLVLDGRLFRGATGGAGELGHMKMSNAGPLCVCGARGCLEALIGDPALAAAASSAAGRSVTVEEAADLARGGDDSLMKVFRDGGSLLGRAVGNLVNVFNPSRIIFAGEATRRSDLFLPAFEAMLKTTVFDGLQDDMSIHLDSWDDEAWARGAASLFLNELFQPNFRQSEFDRPTLVGLAAS